MSNESRAASTTGRSFETIFNAAFGDSLRTVSARWRLTRPDAIIVEQTNVFIGAENKQKRPDILVLDPEIPPVAIECSYDALDADKDAKARLGLQPSGGLTSIKTAIAVHIPAKYRTSSFSQVFELLNHEGEVRYAIHQLTESTEPSEHRFRRWPARGFLTGSVFDLAALVQGAALPKEELEKVAAKVAELVDNAARAFQRAMSDASMLDLSHVVLQRSPLSALRTSMVLWLNALLTQQRLAHSEVEGIKRLHLNPLRRSLTTTEEYLSDWFDIAETNWLSIYQPAINVLRLLGDIAPNVVPQALFQLIRAVNMIEAARVGLNINVGAELFPKLSEDRKQAAAFYTQAASAELLACLTIDSSQLSDAEWRRADLFAHRCIADLACGTGTLLRAGYSRIASLRERLLESNADLSTFHKHAMESGLIGTDVSPIAAHLTASSLVEIGHGMPYGETRIGWLEVGGTANATGSLEYFERSDVSDLFDAVSASGRTRGDNGAAYSVAVPNDSVDWVLMNPPYSRTRGGQSAFDIAGLTTAERRSCQRRWAQLIQNEPAIKTAGMAASFLALARKKVKPGGRIGFVLPLSAAFAESWRKSRRMVELEFEDITVVAVAARKAQRGEGFSADTGMEEMLLAATRRSSSRDEHCSDRSASSIRCVTLSEPVARCGEAGELARVIANATAKLQGETTHLPIMLGEDEIGTANMVRTRGDGKSWSPLGVVHGDLAQAAERLRHGWIDFAGHVEKLPIDMTALQDLMEVGPTHHLLGHLRGKTPTGAFEFNPVRGKLDAIGADRSLWHADARTQNTLLVLPTHKGFVNPAVSSETSRSMRKTLSTTFYARNMRWTSQALLLATTELPCLGGRSWTSLQHPDHRVVKMLSIWVNSVFGLITHWTQGQRTQVGRATTQVTALKAMRCPNFSQLDECTLDLAAQTFDAISTSILMPACQAHVDNVRMELDDAVMDILSLSSAVRSSIDKLRTLWCHEPSVHGWNREAVSKLQGT